MHSWFVVIRAMQRDLYRCYLCHDRILFGSLRLYLVLLLYKVWINFAKLFEAQGSRSSDLQLDLFHEDVELVSIERALLVLISGESKEICDLVVHLLKQGLPMHVARHLQHLGKVLVQVDLDLLQAGQ